MSTRFFKKILIECERAISMTLTVFLKSAPNAGSPAIGATAELNQPSQDRRNNSQNR